MYNEIYLLYVYMLPMCIGTELFYEVMIPLPENHDGSLFHSLSVCLFVCLSAAPAQKTRFYRSKSLPISGRFRFSPRLVYIAIGSESACETTIGPVKQTISGFSHRSPGVWSGDDLRE